MGRHGRRKARADRTTRRVRAEVASWQLLAPSRFVVHSIVVAILAGAARTCAYDVCILQTSTEYYDDFLSSLPSLASNYSTKLAGDGCAGHVIVLTPFPLLCSSSHCAKSKEKQRLDVFHQLLPTWPPHHGTLS